MRPLLRESGHLPSPPVAACEHAPPASASSWAGASVSQCAKSESILETQAIHSPRSYHQPGFFVLHSTPPSSSPPESTIILIQSSRTSAPHAES
ncbi:hypothetical protein PaG_02185 [Moesziomyces aphidis]|uniref:Uncharacterized protein n=1 Tax=Moesziomyces aphidis TaxID=84754 RepID=W3VQC3_MOEAP|nr:hypothetical protein PaG_02185 [Moesziomyces aphidis]